MPPNHPTPYAAPDASGHFGAYGGTFVPEILIPELAALKQAFAEAWPDAAFQDEYRALLHDYVGRPTPLTFADRLTEALGGPKIDPIQEEAQ